MNKVNLLDIINDNVKTRSVVHMFGAKATVWGHIYAKWNLLTNKADIHICADHLGINSASDRNDTCYDWLSLTEIAKVCRCTNISFDPLSTRVTCYNLSSPLSDNTNTSFPLGVWGNVLMATDNGMCAAIARCNDANNMFTPVKYPLSHKIYDNSGKYFDIDIWDATLIW